METIKFFDCSASFGRRQIIHKGSFYELEDLLRKMKYYGIEAAMVYHSLAVEYEPALGNRMLTEQIAAFPNLRPVWIVMPHYTGEFPHPRDLREKLKAHNIRAVRIESGGGGRFGMAEWSSGALLTMLEECRVPVMISASRLNWNYQIVYDVLSAHPGLRLILTGIPYHAARSLYPLLERFPFLYLESIGFKVFGGIVDICERFGAERLIFGSSAPLYSGGSAVGMVLYADISEREKRMIACENLEKLLEEVSL